MDGNGRFPSRFSSFRHGSSSKLCFGSSICWPPTFLRFFPQLVPGIAPNFWNPQSESKFSKNVFPGHAAASLHLRSSSLHIGAAGGECFLLALGRDAQGLDEGRGCGIVVVWNLCYCPSWKYNLAPDKMVSQKEVIFSNINFQVRTVSLREGWQHFIGVLLKSHP